MVAAKSWVSKNRRMRSIVSHHVAAIETEDLQFTRPLNGLQALESGVKTSDGPLHEVSVLLLSDGIPESLSSPCRGMDRDHQHQGRLSRRLFPLPFALALLYTALTTGQASCLH